MSTRRRADLNHQINRTFAYTGPGWQAVQQQICRSEESYRTLFEKKDKRAYSEIDEQRCREADLPLLRLLHGMQGSALCLSGGGIRSASFSLGVLEGLSRFSTGGMQDVNPTGPSLMHELDYLSTVSGGGYIGCWFMAWVTRLQWKETLYPLKPGILFGRARKRLERERVFQPGAAYQTAVRALAGLAAHTSGDPAPRTIRHLREYTSFLAPKLGFTLDTLALLSIVVRNLVVNWAMIVPLLVCVVAQPLLFHFGLTALAEKLSGTQTWPLWIAGGLFFWAGIVAAFRMPSRNAERWMTENREPWIVSLLFVLPLAVASLLLLSLWFGSANAHDFRDEWFSFKHIFWRLFAMTFVSFGIIVPIRISSLGRACRVAKREHKPLNELAAGLAVSCLVAALTSASLCTLGQYGGRLLTWAPRVAQEQKITSEPQTFTLQTPRGEKVTSKAFSTLSMQVDASAPVSARVDSVAINRRFVTWGFPLVWVIVLVMSALYSGFLGIFEEDMDREWWARAGGLMMGLLALWIVGQVIVVYGPDFVDRHFNSVRLTGGITGLLGALGGWSASTGAGTGTKKGSGAGKVSQFLGDHDLLVPALCSVALLVLTLEVARGVIWIEGQLTRTLFHVQSNAQLPTQHPVHIDFEAYLLILVVSLLLGLVVNWMVNINLFSLHGMYRMRLMRAFMGASNNRRRANDFTGFDDTDNVAEADIARGPGVPMHVINATVNLVGTRDPAWRQRKGEGFTFTPQFCGGWRLGYVLTRRYGRRGGVSMGTAMAISGAAFNPNMGYHSSPTVTLLMTLFNVRLGWWLPNPKYRRGPLKKWFYRTFFQQNNLRDFQEKKSPRFALRPLISEALGATNDTYAYIELTDGGHFENLGLYEMVLRRCHKIIVVDAGADPDCTFEDLGNALRKIEIDLGVPISFSAGVHMEKGAQASNSYCAVARICYECVDGAAAPSEPATLVYIKAALRGMEPPDVRQYAAMHPTFPHEATVNQFFNEAQFESYRHLGSFEVESIVREGRDKLLRPGEYLSGMSFADFIEAASA